MEIEGIGYRERAVGLTFWPVQCRMQPLTLPKRERAFDLLVHTICRVGVCSVHCAQRERESAERSFSGEWVSHSHCAVRGRFSGEVKKK